MAETFYGVNDPLAVKLWSKKLAVEALKATWFNKFVGKDSSSLIQIKDETSKGPGDRVTYGLRMQLQGAGVLGDGTLEGNEEPLTTFSDQLIINQLRHAVRSAGRMSQQRVSFDIRQEGLDGLVDWWSDRLDTCFFNQICGYTPVNDLRFTGMNLPIAPDVTHYRNAHAATSVLDSDLVAADTFTLSILDYAVERARTGTPALRPIKMGGKDWWVAFLHPFQATSLRTNTATGQWLDIEKAAMTGGIVKDNPIFDGSLGVYNGVILHADNRVTMGVSAGGLALPNVRRAVLCGAQAVMLGFGRNGGVERYDWNEEMFDYGNQLGVEAGSIFGLKKTVFNAKDFATITLPTWAVAS